MAADSVNVKFYTEDSLYKHNLKLDFSYYYSWFLKQM